MTFLKSLDDLAKTIEQTKNKKLKANFSKFLAFLKVEMGEYYELLTVLENLTKNQPALNPEAGVVYVKRGSKK